MSTSTLLIYIFFGSVALSYMMYGKSQRKAIALLSGIGLAVLTLFQLGYMAHGIVVSSDDGLTFFHTHIKHF